MAVKLTRMTHKIAIQLQLVAEICTICSSRSRRPVRKLLYTLWYTIWEAIQGQRIFNSKSASQFNIRGDYKWCERLHKFISNNRSHYL